MAVYCNEVTLLTSQTYLGVGGLGFVWKGYTGMKT